MARGHFQNATTTANVWRRPKVAERRQCLLTEVRIQRPKLAWWSRRLERQEYTSENVDPNDNANEDFRKKMASKFANIVRSQRVSWLRASRSLNCSQIELFDTDRAT